MAQYLPPTQDLPIFDSSVFVQASDNLTIEDANRLYIRFPTAQGEVNLLKTNVFDDLTVDGNVQCHTLKYTALDPPVDGGTPLLSTILEASPDAGGGRIIDLEQLVSQDIEATSITTQTLNYTTLNPAIAGAQNLAEVLREGSDADGEAINNVSVLGATTIDATTITVGTLNYSELNPPISGAIPTLSQVLTAGSDATGQVIENLDGLFVGSVFLKDFSGGQSNAITFSGAQSLIEIENNINMPNNNIKCDTLEYQHIAPYSGFLDNNLLDFMIPNTSTVSTTNLEPAAQTALNLSAINEADIVVLQETTLQLAGDPATYTGLLDTNMSLNGELQMNNYDITNVNEITALGVNGDSIKVKNADDTNYYDISGNTNGVIVNANITTPVDITCRTLNYTNLNPPVSGGGSQNIEQVLITGSNANGQSLSGLNTLTSTNIQSTNAGGTALIKANDIGIYNNDGTTQKAVISKDGNIFSQNYYLYGQSASDFAITNNKNILTTGNITSNLLTSQTVSTPALASSLGYITSPSIVMPVGSLTCKNGAGNGVIETNAIRIYSDASTYSAVLATDGTVFAKSYQMFNQTPSKFSVSNAGSVFATKLEVDETLADSSSSVGTSGQVLSSTGTGIQWITPSAGGTPSLSDVMTVGNTASTILNMNNNTVDNALSVFTKTLYSVDNVEGGNIYSNNLTIQDGTGTPQLTITPVGDITTSGTIQSADITVGTTTGQQVILSNIGEVRCSSLNIPSDALTPAFSITNDGTAFTTKLEIGETLADASNSVGTAGQLLSSTGTATAWVDAPTSNPTLGDVMTNGNTASTDLNMNSNDITNTASLALNGTYNIIQSVNAISNALEFTTEFGFATLKCDSLDADGLSANNITIANTVEAGTLKLNGSLLDENAFAGFPTQYLKSTGSGVEWSIIQTPSLSDVMMIGNVAGNNLNMNKRNFYNAITMGLSSNSSPKEIELQMNDTTPETLDIKSRSVGIYTPANISCNLVNGTDINYRPTYDYFVAKNGSDTNSGSVLSPFLTIQKAIDICEAFTDNVPRNINIFYGSYVENLTISKSRIAFNGSNMAGSRADTGCSITGSILINVSSGLSDLNNNNIYFNNLLINGIMADTSSVVHRVGIKDCYIYGNNTVLNFTSSAEYRLFVDYCYLNNESTTSTNPLVNCAGSTDGMVSFTNNQMTSRAKGHVLSVSCRTDTIALNIMTNDNVGADVLAICKLGSTVNNTAYTLGQNAFIYSSTTSKSSGLPYFSTGILMDAPVSKTNFLTVINNTFVMAGLANSLTNFAITGTRNSSATAYIFYLNNTGVSTFLSPYSFQIDSGSGINKNALQVVQ